MNKNVAFNITGIDPKNDNLLHYEDKQETFLVDRFDLGHSLKEFCDKYKCPQLLRLKDPVIYKVENILITEGDVDTQGTYVIVSFAERNTLFKSSEVSCNFKDLVNILNPNDYDYLVDSILKLYNENQ